MPDQAASCPTRITDLLVVLGYLPSKGQECGEPKTGQLFHPVWV